MYFLKINIEDFCKILHYKVRRKGKISCWGVCTYQFDSSKEKEGEEVLERREISKVPLQNGVNRD